MRFLLWFLPLLELFALLAHTACSTPQALSEEPAIKTTHPITHAHLRGADVHRSLDQEASTASSVPKSTPPGYPSEPRLGSAVAETGSLVALSTGSDSGKDNGNGSGDEKVELQPATDIGREGRIAAGHEPEEAKVRVPRRALRRSGKQTRSAKSSKKVNSRRASKPSSRGLGVKRRVARIKTIKGHLHRAFQKIGRVSASSKARTAVGQKDRRLHGGKKGRKAQADRVPEQGAVGARQIRRSRAAKAGTERDLQEDGLTLTMSDDGGSGDDSNDGDDDSSGDGECAPLHVSPLTYSYTHPILCRADYVCSSIPACT